MDERLRPTERLKRSSEYDEVFKCSSCFRSPYLRIVFRETDRDPSRLGLVVSRRLGNAVTRSRLRRLLREVFRKNKHTLPRPMDVVLVPQGEPRGYSDYLCVFRSFVERAVARQKGGHRR